MFLQVSDSRMTDNPATEEETIEVWFNELEEGTPLYLSDEPYHVTRTCADGESDLELLASSDVQEEGGWMFSHDQSVWYNLRIGTSLEREDDRITEVSAEFSIISPSSVGERVTIYHIHPRLCVDEHFHDLWKEPTVESHISQVFPSEYVEEQKRICQAQCGFMAALPTPDDIEAFQLIQSIYGDCEVDYKIVSQLGITTITLDTEHPDFEHAVDEYAGFKEYQPFPPWETGESIVKMLDQNYENKPISIDFTIGDAISISIQVAKDYQAGKSS